MSTRCMLLVRQKEIWGNDTIREFEALRIYRHCDGYPEGMGMDIAEACREADSWHDMNNRNWAQPFLHELFGMDADMEVCNPDEEHGDIEFLYVVTGTRDVSWGKVGVQSYGLEIAVYQPDWDQTCEEVMKGEPIFRGDWMALKGWIGVKANPLSSKCLCTLFTTSEGKEVMVFSGNDGVESIEVGDELTAGDILDAIRTVNAIE